MRRIKQLMPCADSNCKSQMRYKGQNEDYITFRCLQKPIEHRFRFKRNGAEWEQVICYARPIDYNESPYEEPQKRPQKKF